MRFAVSQVPPDKLFMGIPNYGYDWTLPYVQGQSRARSLGSVQAVEQAIQVGAPIRYDATAQSPHYNYWRDRTEHEVWFEGRAFLSAPSWRLPENISWQASASGILCGIFRSCGLC